MQPATHTPQAAQYRPCPTCRARGVVPDPRWSGDPQDGSTLDCPTCDGACDVTRAQCPDAFDDESDGADAPASLTDAELRAADERCAAQSIAGVRLAYAPAEEFEAPAPIGELVSVAALADAAADRLRAQRLAAQVARWEKIVASYRRQGMRTHARRAERTLAGARRAAGLAS
jgi:hypothetical protein